MSSTSSLIRSWLLPAYYVATLPARKWSNRRAATSGRMPIPILFYHRVADGASTPWTMSNAEFERQVTWLSNHFELIGLPELQRRLQNRDSSRPAVSITFDDGYAENCDAALPLLISQRIPFTYFVTSHHVISGEPFAHDVAQGVVAPPNTVAQLRSLAAVPGVQIGAHTRTHPDLGKIHDTRTLFNEVVESRDELQQALGTGVDYFAFPFGQPRNLNAAAIDMARESGFSGVCSAYGGYNRVTPDPFHLVRLHGDPCFARLKNWVTVDPRLLHRRSQWHG